ncbi:MAG: c-type cytochrome [Candidatus Obscuribacterales bacterium]|nr:c-type cytochrome [Candidatus Obscuribacterales bacterium]
MKFTKILPLLPMIALLSSCGEEVKLPSGDKMVSEQQTAAPHDFVVYPDDRPSIPDGKLVFDKQNCASCHGADGAGIADKGPALNDNRAMSGKKPVELYKALTYGNDPHKMQGKLSVRETWNLVFYTRSLACPPLSQAQIDEINPVFGSNCAVCHGTKGDGEGPLARNLEPSPANFTTFRRFYDRTDDTLFDHIANGIKWEGMPNFLGKEDKKKNVKFDHEYIRKLVQYVRNFHVSGEPTVVAAAGTQAAAPAAAPAPTQGSAEKEAPAEEAKSTETAAPAQDKNSAESEKKAEGAAKADAPAADAGKSETKEQ